MGSRAVITVSSAAAGEVQLAVSGVVDLAAVGELARQLLGVLDSPGVALVVVDLSAARRCDCQVLEVLDQARRDLAARDGVLHIRGLDPQALTGFGSASLPAVLGAYRASLGASGRTAPWEPGGTAALAVCSGAAHQLAQACVELAAGGPAVLGVGAPRGGAAGVADRLIEHCGRYLGPVAAVVLLAEPAGRPVVVSSATERARLVELSGAAAGQGPGVECLRRGELVSAPDLTQITDRWAGYTRAARRHRFAAARALPIRRPPAGTWPGRAGPMIGALVLLAETPGPMAPADLGMAQAFADLAAIGMAGRAQRGVEDAGHVAAVSGAAMADRVIIEQASGILAERHALTMAQAGDRLRRHARTHDLSLTEAAREVLAGQLAGPGAPPPRPDDDRPARPARHVGSPASSPDAR